MRKEHTPWGSLGEQKLLTLNTIYHLKPTSQDIHNLSDDIKR